MTSTEVGITLLERFVEALNNPLAGAMDDLVDVRYCDHHPLVVPPLLTIMGRRTGAKADLDQLLSLLRHRATDMSFSLEDVFASSDRVGYRLFGEGTLGVRDLLPGISEEQMTQMAQGGRSHTPAGKLLTNTMWVGYECTGIFRVEHGVLVERWGMPWLK